MMHHHLPRNELAWPVKYCMPERLQTVLWQLPKPWVFTHGVFDLLQRGHVQRLAEARQQGASLIVAIHSDALVRQQDRAAGNPFNPESDRAWVLAALESVSLVTCLNEADPLKLLARIRPEVYVGGDDAGEMALLPEAHLMGNWGGRRMSLPRHAGVSTAQLIERIRHPAPRYAPDGLASVPVQLYDVTRN